MYVPAKNYSVSVEPNFERRPRPSGAARVRVPSSPRSLSCLRTLAHCRAPTRVLLRSPPRLPVLLSQRRPCRATRLDRVMESTPKSFRLPMDHHRCRIESESFEFCVLRITALLDVRLRTPLARTWRFLRVRLEFPTPGWPRGRPCLSESAGERIQNRACF